MSSVLARFRHISDMEYYQTAIDIRHEISVFLRSDKNVPRRYTDLYVTPIIKRARLLTDYVVAIFYCYPDSQEKLDQRREYMDKAISIVRNLEQCIQELEEDLWFEILRQYEGSKDRKRIEYHVADISKLLHKEEELLKGLKNKSRILDRFNKKKSGDRPAELEKAETKKSEPANPSAASDLPDYVPH